MVRSAGTVTGKTDQTKETAEGCPGKQSEPGNRDPGGVGRATRSGPERCGRVRTEIDVRYTRPDFWARRVGAHL